MKKLKLLFIPIIIGIITLNANFAFGQSACMQTCEVTAGPNQTLACCCACVTLGNGSFTATCGGLTIPCSGCAYSWSPAAGLSATNIATPCAHPTVTTTYTLTVNYAPGGVSKCCCFLATGDHCGGNMGTPCPTMKTGMFTLSMDEHQSSVSMDVFDMQGKNVWSQDNISDKTITINISNLPKGAYFIQVKDNDKVTYVKKIIIQ